MNWQERKEQFAELPKKVKVIFFSGIAAFAIILIVVLVAILSGSNKIDLSQTCVIKVDGLDTKGIASYQLDKQSLEKTVMGKTINIIKADMFIDTVKCNLSKKENLKNDDEIVAKITYDETLAKQLNLSFKNTEIKVKVSGLPKGKTIDVFKDIQVNYTGTSPEGAISIINKSTDPFTSKVNFKCKNDFVANADKIEIEAIYDNQEAIDQKIIVQSDSKTYTVSGLPEYLRNSTQLTTDMINQFTQADEKSINSYVRTQGAFFVNHIENRTTDNYYTYGDTYSCKNIKLLKSYIVTEKDNSSWSNFKHNSLCCIYSADLLANGTVIGNTCFQTELYDIVIKDAKAESTTDNQFNSITQRNTLEKAQQAVEDTYQNYNLEPITIK